MDRSFDDYWFYWFVILLALGLGIFYATRGSAVPMWVRAGRLITAQVAGICFALTGYYHTGPNAIGYLIGGGVSAIALYLLNGSQNSLRD